MGGQTDRQLAMRACVHGVRGECVGGWVSLGLAIIPQSSTGGYTVSICERVRVNPCVHMRGECVGGGLVG